MLRAPVRKTSTIRSQDEGQSPNDNNECDQVYAAIKRWKAHDGAVLLPVVNKSTVARLQERAKPRWWKMKKTAAKATLCITTPQNLQVEIDNTASQDQVHELFILVSRQVDLPTVEFAVPSSIDNLYIIRCGDPAGERAQGVEDRLVLNGSSTFCGVRLDEWQAKRAGEHNLILGPGVVIELRGMGIPWTARDALASISKQQREEVTRHFREMCEARYQDAPEWQRWKGPVNQLLDVAAGSTTAAQVVECYAGGIVVQAATRLAEHGLDGALKVSAGLLCLSGPGKIALGGAALAAAIYYVPWDTVWGWFRASFGALLNWLVRAWENLKAWVTSAARGQANKASGKQGVEMGMRPMLT